MNLESRKIKVIITDLDGTLLNPEHKISSYTKSVFKELYDQNYLIIVATGRHHIDAFGIIDTFGIPVYLVSSNGARIHSLEKKELFAFNIQSDVIKQVLEVDIDPEITTVLFKEDVWLTNRLSEKLNSFQANLVYHPKLVDYSKLKDYTAIKIFFTHSNHEKLVALKDRILSVTLDKLHHAFSLPNCLEFMDKSVDKSVAIAKILKIENATFEESICFGDGFNDVKMLLAAGKGLIMGNAPQNLKNELPQMKVINTNKEDGVAKYLSKKILGKVSV